MKQKSSSLVCRKVKSPFDNKNLVGFEINEEVVGDYLSVDI